MLLIIKVRSQKYVKILEIFFSKALRVCVNVYVAVELLKSLFRCLSSVHSDIIRTQVKLYMTSHLYH